MLQHQCYLAKKMLCKLSGIVKKCRHANKKSCSHRLPCRVLEKAYQQWFNFSQFANYLSTIGNLILKFRIIVTKIWNRYDLLRIHAVERSSETLQLASWRDIGSLPQLKENKKKKPSPLPLPKSNWISKRRKKANPLKKNLPPQRKRVPSWRMREKTE